MIDLSILFKEKSEEEELWANARIWKKALHRPHIYPDSCYFLQNTFFSFWYK